MFASRTILLLLAATALITGAMCGSAAAGPDLAGASGKPKHCKRGGKVRTVIRKGRKVKRCRQATKVKKPPVSSPGPGPGSNPGAETTTPDSAKKPLFDPPGKILGDEEALPFLARYLANSTFTSCPAGWPNCPSERRFSHAADQETFHACRLPALSEGDSIVGVYTLNLGNTVVEPDGSWRFEETISSIGGSYRFEVAIDGAIKGTYENGLTEEDLGPLSYLGGVAKDCS